MAFHALQKLKYKTGHILWKCTKYNCMFHNNTIIFIMSFLFLFTVENIRTLIKVQNVIQSGF